jgi:hypothetical protein
METEKMPFQLTNGESETRFVSLYSSIGARKRYTFELVETSMNSRVIAKENPSSSLYLHIYTPPLLKEALLYPDHFIN